MLNDLFSQLDIAAWKPLLTALVLPPVPFVLCLLFGARRLSRRRRGGWTLVWLAAAGIWFGSTAVVGDALQHQLWPAQQAHQAQALPDIVSRNPGSAPDTETAIVVLGGGREGWSAEYGAANLNVYSLARLRYGLWLSRRTGLPVAYSGGVGHAQSAGNTEAQIAARIA
ncbi:MAG: YdcF family protein, partial [Rubrivivax sp.]